MQRQREEASNFDWGDLLLELGGVAAGLLLAGANVLEEQEKKKEDMKIHNRMLKGVYSSSHNNTRSIVGITDSYNIHLNKEFDKWKRSADVYLYTSPIDELPNAVNAMFHHWAIVVRFVDGTYRTLDGFSDDNGCLCARYEKKSPKYHYLQKLKLGRLVTSPYNLWKCAMTNVLNDTPFNSCTNNCQDWVVALAKDLGMDIFKKLQKIGRVSEVSEGAAILFGVGSALFSSFTNSSNVRR